MVRSPSFSASGERKGAWSPEEDAKLKAYIMRYGNWNWQQLPRFAGLQRSGNSCRQRWINYLRPDVRGGPFSEEEKATIIRLHRVLGNRWSEIACRLPGRTGNEMKNFWHTHLRKKLHIQTINEPESSNSVRNCTVDQLNSFVPVKELDSGLNWALHPRNVEHENEQESSCSVGNYSVIKRNSFFADQAQCSGDRDSDFTDINVFTRILRGW